MVVFNDLECPFCARFDGGPLLEVLGGTPGEISVTFVQLPLSGMHRFAFPAAHAAECADRQGWFNAFVDVVFANQDRWGLRTWS